MAHTITGVFESRRLADLVVEHLVQEFGIRRERVRVYAGDREGGTEARSAQDSDQSASIADIGLPEETVRLYESALRGGSILVAAQVEADRVERILAAYHEYGAADVMSREAEWRG